MAATRITGELYAGVMHEKAFVFIKVNERVSAFAYLSPDQRLRLATLLTEGTNYKLIAS